MINTAPPASNSLFQVFGRLKNGFDITKLISQIMCVIVVQNMVKELFARADKPGSTPGDAVFWGLSAGTGKLCIFGHLGLVFIWNCFVSRLLFLLYYVICAPVLTEGTVFCFFVFVLFFLFSGLCFLTLFFLLPVFLYSYYRPC